MENKNYNHCCEFFGNGVNVYLIQQSGNYGENDDLDVFVVETLKKLNKVDVIGILNNYNNKIEHKDKDIKFYDGTNDLGYYFAQKYGVYVAEWMSGEGVKNIINRLKGFGFAFMSDYVLDIAEKVEEKKVEIIGCNCRVCKEYNEWAIPDGVVGDGKYTCWNCASSYHRIIRGLDIDKIDSQVAMIRKNYKMGV